MTTVEPPTGHDNDRPRCGANKRQGEGSCTQAAGWGTSHPGVGHCKLHGGSAPSHVKAAAKAIAQRGVETFGLPREVDPHTALLEEVHRTAGAVSWLGAVVADLEAGAVVWGITRKAPEGKTSAAGVSVWVQLWQAERKHLVSVAKVCIDAGIEERRIRIAEEQGQELAGAIRRILDRLFGALSDALGPYEAARRVVEAMWSETVPVVVPAELRALGEGGRS